MFLQSSTEIKLAPAADLSPGEHVIEAVSADGRSGHRRDWIGRPENLYERLPLPGRDLTGKPGTYSVTSDEFDDTFYGIEMQSLIGCDGALYAFCKSRDLKTSVFRYDIGKKDWNEVYNGGYSADSGVCTWKGRILFFANDEYNAKAYLGVFDPETCTAQYYLQNDKDGEKGLFKWVTVAEAFADIPDPDLPNELTNHVYSKYKLDLKKIQDEMR